MSILSSRGQEKPQRQIFLQRIRPKSVRLLSRENPFGRVLQPYQCCYAHSKNHKNHRCLLDLDRLHFFVTLFQNKHLSPFIMQLNTQKRDLKAYHSGEAQVLFHTVITQTYDSILLIYQKSFVEFAFLSVHQRGESC